MLRECEVIGNPFSDRPEGGVFAGHDGTITALRAVAKPKIEHFTGP
jgi:hypothetical protein